MKKFLAITLLLQFAIIGQVAGQATGKRQHKPLQPPVKKMTDSLGGIQQPGNTSSPQPATGKREHIPVVSAVNNNENNATTQQYINKFRDDSLLWIKNNPGKPFIRTSQSVAPQAGQVNNTKLDDLKNPFDTTKKVKKVLQ